MASSAIETFELNNDLKSSDGVRVASLPGTRRGRQFEPAAERQLHPWAVEAAHRIPGADHGVILLPEMAGPIGVPDFVAVVGGQPEIEARLRRGVPAITSPIDISILAQLSARRSTRPAAVSGRLGLPASYLQSRLRRLDALGAISTLATGSLRLDPVMEPAGRVIAIETKLRDWRRAIHQARRYRTWAENYVLVLGGISRESARAAREIVQHDGGGLHVDGHWLVRPRRRSVTREARFRGSEAVIAALVGYQPSSSLNS